MKPRRRDLLIYQLLDFLAACLAWFLFFVYRKRIELGSIHWEQIFDDKNLYFGIIIIPIGWMILYILFDRYNDVYRLSRVATIGRTFFISIAGVLVLFFTVLIDDLVLNYVSYFKPFLRLFLLHFSITVALRILWLSLIKSNLKRGKVAFKTAILGAGRPVSKVYEELSHKPYQLGHSVCGIVSLSPQEEETNTKLAYLGSLVQLNEIVEKHALEDIIIALENSHRNQVKHVIKSIRALDQELVIKVVPELYDAVLGNAKLSHIYGAPFIELDSDLMPKWQWIVKRSMDKSISLLGLILLSPLLAYIAWRVMRSSAGPVIFSQERIGKAGKPFLIYKFRSMVMNAEANGPQLSHDTDLRITEWGKVMRKWRIDELPQLWNVLKGDMSLVGPRPERQFFIDQLAKDVPFYKQILKIRPGITSWGQVKYGYASNLSEMKQRLRFDILYLENMSITLDIKILFYTVLVLIQGKGK